MKTRNALCGLISGILLFAQPASAVVTILAEEIGDNVVFSWGGLGQSLDLTGATFLVTSSGGELDQIEPARPALTRGRFGVALDYYADTSTASFGVGGDFIASSGSGGPFAFANVAVGVPTGYVSGDPIAPSSLTFDSTDFITMGITPIETTVFTLPNDSIVITFVPEPARALLSLLGLGVVLVRRRR